MSNNLKGMVADDPIIIDSLPIAFAIMGPKRSHRGVLVRSSLFCLDLVGLDRSPNAIWMPGTSLGLLFRTQPQSSVIQSSSTVKASFLSTKDDPIDIYDNRKSGLTFAWKGLVTKNNIKEITETLTLLTPDLVRAIQDQHAADVEWHIAPLIAQCQLFHDNLKSRLYFRRIAFVITGLIYVVFATLVTVKIFPGRF